MSDTLLIVAAVAAGSIAMILLLKWLIHLSEARGRFWQGGHGGGDGGLGVGVDGDGSGGWGGGNGDCGGGDGGGGDCGGGD